MSVITTPTAAPTRFTTVIPVTPVTPPSMVVSYKQDHSGYDFTVTFSSELAAPNDTSFFWCVPADKSTIGKPRTNAELFVRSMSMTSGIISNAKLRHVYGGSVLTFTILGSRKAKKAQLRLQWLAQKYLGITA